MHLTRRLLTTAAAVTTALATTLSAAPPTAAAAAPCTSTWRAVQKVAVRRPAAERGTGRDNLPRRPGGSRGTRRSTCWACTVSPWPSTTPSPACTPTAPTPSEVAQYEDSHQLCFARTRGPADDGQRDGGCSIAPPR